MKKSILQLTDLHLEWNTKLTNFSSVLPNKIADFVVLTGDIAVGTNALNFIKHLLKQGSIVIYVLGNHEFYNNNVDLLIEEWRKISNEIDNFYFLEGESVLIEDIEFFGSCLWTSLGTRNKQENVDFFLKQRIKRSDDFFSIKNWSVDKMKNYHYDSILKLKNLISKSKSNNKVVLTHYLPSYQSIHPNFIHNENNCFWASELIDFIYNSDIDYWFHGHTHNSCDYFIDTLKGKCNVFCNPYGYHEYNQINPDFSWTDFIKYI